MALSCDGNGKITLSEIIDEINRMSKSSIAAPTTGTYAVGDTVLNSAPTAGGYIGWVCITAGTPGVWEPYGKIGL